MKKHRGFTLIEVLVAMMILAGALIALSASWSGSALSYRKAKRLDVISTLLQQKMTEYELQYEQEFPFDEVEEAGDFEGEYPDLSWRLEVRKMELPDLTPLLAADGEAVDQMTLTVIRQMTEFLNQSIKEMRVTIVWTSKGRSLDYTASTYIVNFDQPLQLGGGGGQ